MELIFIPSETLIKKGDYKADFFGVDAPPVAQKESFLIDEKNGTRPSLKIDAEARFLDGFADDAFLGHQIETGNGEARAVFRDIFKNSRAKQPMEKHLDFDLGRWGPAGTFQTCSPWLTRAAKASTHPQKEAMVVSRSGDPCAVTKWLPL